MKEPEKKPRRRVKKVKAHGGGHHGGAWKVAYADFVTAMMALFLVLWLVSQADVKVKQAIANYFRAPGVFDSLRGGVIDGPRKVSKEPTMLTAKDDEQALFSTAELLRKKFETRPEFSKYRDQIKIDVTPEGLKIQIIDQAERVSFSSGSSELTPDAAAIIAEVARGICQLPNPILIGGHTDRHLFPEGSTYSNWELSADRANAARRALEANCVKPEQIRRIVGYADTELSVPDDPFSPANRRISITLMRLHSQGGERSGDENVSESLDPSAVGAEARPHAGAAAEPQTEARPGDAKAVERGKSVTVGEPDVIPENIKRSRESAPPPSAQGAEAEGKGH